MKRRLVTKLMMAAGVAAMAVTTIPASVFAAEDGGQTYGVSGDECPNGVIGRCYSCDGGSGEAGSFGYNPSYATFITGSAGARNGNGLATIKFIG